MRRIGILAVMFGLAALQARAQTNVTTTGGTPGTIAKFTGSTTVGDSQIRQIDDNIGINTDFIVGRLSVLESRESGVNPFFPAPYAVYGNILSGMNFAAGVRGDASSTTGSASGVIGVNYSTDGGAGVIGLASASTGHAAGVSGSTNSPDGLGVVGFAIGRGPGVHGDAMGDGGTGVNGVTSSKAGFAVGTRGTASGSTGNGVGVFGEAFSPNGIAGLFVNRPGGDVLVGSVSQNPDIHVFRVDGHGTVFADGGFRPFGADFAESVAVSGSAEHYAPGDLLVIDASGERRLSVSQTPYSTLVAGIYSTQPGVVASRHRVDEALPKNEIPLAVVGIVPCKVTAENGPIVVGDLLVTSSTPGHAMKGTDRSRMLGAVVGKALEPLQKGTGLIQVLVTLQ